MNGVAEAVERVRVGWSGPFVETSIAGTSEPAAIESMIDEWCRAHLGAPVRRGRWYHASVGMVAGLDLADGRPVVVKAYQPRFTSTFLRDVVRFQQHLAACWYPCSTPIAGPAPFGLGQATAEAMLDDPGPPAIDERDLVASVAGLVRLVRYTDGIPAAGLDPHPLQLPAGGRYPEPHSPIFDFGRDAAAVRWVDELADAALAARHADRTRPVVIHADWSARNVRFDARGVRAVFDLDSLCLTQDAIAAGQAAVTWATTMELDEPELPDPSAMARFLDTYQGIRGYRFRPTQVRAFWGAALWFLAYTARCEHAIGRAGLATAHLQRHGDELATLASAA